MSQPCWKQRLDISKLQSRRPSMESTRATRDPSLGKIGNVRMVAIPEGISLQQRHKDDYVRKDKWLSRPSHRDQWMV
eukprot:2271961-Amphidinium_carterae.1